jgi:hypothetical protein
MRERERKRKRKRFISCNEKTSFDISIMRCSGL